MTEQLKCGCKFGVRGKNCSDYHASHYEAASAAKEDAEAFDAAGRPEQTALPPLDVTDEERSRIANMRPMAPRNTLLALERLACRERQLLTACNNYEALRDVVKIMQDAMNDKAHAWNRARKWLDEHDVYHGDLQENVVLAEVCKVALANAKALTENL